MAKLLLDSWDIYMYLPSVHWLAFDLQASKNSERNICCLLMFWLSGNPPQNNENIQERELIPTCDDMFTAVQVT